MDDANIVQLYWDRNEQAIPATADKYGSYCTSIAKNILGNHEDTEECVNDTYLNAWNSMPPHRPSILSTFLGKIVRNLSFNRYKHNTADKRGGGELPVVLEELCDLVDDEEMLDLVEMEVREILEQYGYEEDTPIIRGSALMKSWQRAYEARSMAHQEGPLFDEKQGKWLSAQ